LASNRMAVLYTMSWYFCMNTSNESASGIFGHLRRNAAHPKLQWGIEAKQIHRRIEAFCGLVSLSSSANKTRQQPEMFQAILGKLGSVKPPRTRASATQYHPPTRGLSGHHDAPFQRHAS
jgi:hypothetical protein